MAKAKKRDLLFNSIRQKPSNALSEIRDRCLLLILANEYLCEKVFLFRMGIAITSYAEALRGEIIALKKRFPGKFVHEVETDKMLSDIKAFAENLKKGDKETKRKCLSGQLGHELEEKVNTLSKAIQIINEQVEGDSVSYSAKDSFSGLFGRLKAIVFWLWSSTTFISKILVFSLIIALIVFNFLLWTMENEEDYQKQIVKAEEIIHSQEQIITEVENEKLTLAKKMEILQGTNGNVGRNEKLEILALTLQVEDQEQKKNKALIEMDVQKKKVEENRRIIDGLIQKSFWQRLLRM
jgi:hypothetical protein